MSNIQNENWLESAQENFREALETRNIELAKAIIADTLDAGFFEVARSMSLELRVNTI